MLMKAGATFTGPTGTPYASVPYRIEIASGDVPTALKNNWIPVPYGMLGAPGPSPSWFHVGKAITFDELATAGLTNTLSLFQLPPHATLHAIKIKHSVSFGGGALSAYTVSVGDLGNSQLYASPFDVFQAPGATAYQLSSNAAGENAAALTQLYLTATSVGANLNAATVGSVDIWAMLSLNDF